MLMELKEKLKNALEKRNVEKESARSDEGLAKGVVPEHKMEPFHTRQSDECARGSQNLEGKAVASKAKVQAEVYRIMAEVVEDALGKEVHHTRLGKDFAKDYSKSAAAWIGQPQVDEEVVTPQKEDFCYDIIDHLSRVPAKVSLLT
ncbi:hypothetical protein AAC387_Pa02g1607 [Persea americana]